MRRLKTPAFGTLSPTWPRPPFPAVPALFRYTRCYSPKKIKKSDSNRLFLATIGQTRQTAGVVFRSLVRFQPFKESIRMTMDLVFIEDLRIQTVIGVFDWEREITQTVSLDLKMSFDIRHAASSDDIGDTLDYKAVAKRLIQFVENSEFQLVESLAEHCARIVLEEFPVKWVQLKLSKPGAVRGSSAVGVIIERAENSQ